MKIVGMCAGLVITGMLAAPAMAANVGIGVTIGVPGAYYPAPQPVYVQPAPVYAPPPVYVRPAPVYVRPAPVYVEREAYYYRGGHRYHGHRPPPPPHWRGHGYGHDRR
ncbi:hypothetical protein PQR62_04890 [Herbaspirillum lusitanum]|uniref:PXPV repeat-containing protein n=2 Tax=Herbaspirillum lusitanum TaxID=213312 RepID=A0ABW9A3Y2_9BURK